LDNVSDPTADVLDAPEGVPDAPDDVGGPPDTVGDLGGALGATPDPTEVSGKKDERNDPNNNSEVPGALPDIVCSLG
jgi:hypothetical protein